MSLRAFHLFFICTAALFCMGFAVWAFFEHQRTGAPATVVEATFGLAGAGCLIAYALWAQRTLSRGRETSRGGR